jgi:hypothetical protein
MRVQGDHAVQARAARIDGCDAIQVRARQRDRRHGAAREIAFERSDGLLGDVVRVSR